MKRAFICPAIVWLFIANSFRIASASPNAATDTAGALSNDPAVVEKTISTLRDAGSAGLDALLDQYDKTNDPRLIPTIDAVAAQRDARASRLYWYTDVAKAQAAAGAAHKPILYLRMLGKLTDEYSCANSRFFRTVLYANAEVSKFLRERYVLVWVSERPVPVVTIDYGDGRLLKRTVTGNSIHYIITSQGQVIDALPGLYDPKTFVTILNNAATLASTGDLNAGAAAQYLRKSEAALRIAWQADMRKASPQLAGAMPQPMVQAGKNPDARAAMRRAVSKSFAEAPLVAALTPADYAAMLDRAADSTHDSAWQKVAAIHLPDATLDASSVALIRGQNPLAYDKPGVLDRTVQRFEQSIALDTVHNNYQLRRRLLSWLSAAPGPIMVEDLNRRVYAELFLTPRTDPWLGLNPEATYSGLTGDGCVVAGK